VLGGGDVKQIVLQNYKTSEKIALSLVFSLSLVLCEGLLFSVLSENRGKPAEQALTLILMLLYGLLLGGTLVLFFMDFRKWICITEDSITWMSGKTVLKTVPKNQIIAYGVNSHHQKYTPGFPFFCYATISEVSEIARKYWHWRKRLYRKKQLEELEKTQEGMWILQMSIYIYWERYRLEKSRKYIGVNHITKEELHAIGELWQQKPMLLGSLAIYCPWQHI
jgi:hypothetical protein